MKKNMNLRSWLALLLPLLLWGGMQSVQAQDNPYAGMNEAELRAEWNERMGPGNFQAIDMPELVRPGGRYGQRIFYFAEMGAIRAQGNQVSGQLTIGANTFDYAKAVTPLENADSSINYFAIRDPDFARIVDENFAILEPLSKTEEGTWNLEMVTESMGINEGVYLQAWENLPNFDWVISSILVQRASQMDGTMELVLDRGRLFEVPKEEITESRQGRDAILAAVYDPAAFDNLAGDGEFPLWIVLAAFGAGLIIPTILLLTRRRRGKDKYDAGEVEVLEEDPRYLDLRRDLQRAKQPQELLASLNYHFEDSEAITSMVAQTKIALDRKGNPVVAPIPVLKDVAEGETEEVMPEDRKKPIIKIRASGESGEQSENREQGESGERESGENSVSVVDEGVDSGVRVREVVREVKVEKVDNSELKRRLENQKSADEKLTVAVEYWDSAYDMDRELTKELKTLVRSHRTLQKVKHGFQNDNVRSALSEMALTFGKGHTSKVKLMLDRSEAIEQFVQDVEADRVAPEGNRDDERGKTAAHLSEVLRALDTMAKIANRELTGGSRADYKKAGRSLLAGFVLDGTARDVNSRRSFDEMKARMENRLELFNDDIRFSGHQLQADTLSRMNKLVHSFAGKAEDGNIYYEAFLVRYGDLFEKLSTYEDPPTLDELREWWSQVFEMVIHAFDYFRYSTDGNDNSRAKLNVMMVLEGLKLHELPDGDVRPFSERVTDVPRAVRNAREMARSIGIARLDKVLIDGYYIHPKALEPVE